MNNADLPAMPVNGLTKNASGVFDGSVLIHNGMTKREMFAMAAMQGLLASDVCGNMAEHRCAELAVSQADALLAELERAK